MAESTILFGKLVRLGFTWEEMLHELAGGPILSGEGLEEQWAQSRRPIYVAREPWGIERFLLGKTVAGHHPGTPCHRCLF